MVESLQLQNKSRSREFYVFSSVFYETKTARLKKRERRNTIKKENEQRKRKRNNGL